jgi:hypothetical protein
MNEHILKAHPGLQRPEPGVDGEHGQEGTPAS